MITVNAMGDACPIPVIMTKKALEENKGQDTVEVLVDNETAVKNVTKMAESLGTSVTQEKKSEGEYRILIHPSKDGSGKAGESAEETEICCEECATDKGTVVRRAQKAGKLPKVSRKGNPQAEAPAEQTAEEKKNS